MTNLQTSTGRNQQWLEVWQRKYTPTPAVADLHVLDGYDGMTGQQWKALTSFFLSKLAIGPEHDVLEVGCGCGAFLNEIGECRSLSGVDYSENAIAVARQHLSGEFLAAEAADLPFEDHAFDRVLSFGVFFYFDTLDYARRAFHEMLRVCRPGGVIFIGEINDLAKKELAMKLRNESQQQRAEKHVAKVSLDHLYYSKDFFRELATDFNFARYGDITTTFERTRSGVIDKYLVQTMEIDAGNQNDGARLAMYFQRKAEGIDGAYDILADPALLQVVQTIFQLPAEMSYQSIEAQADMITRRLDIEDLSDPAKVDELIERFLPMWDLANEQSVAVPPLISGTGTITSFSVDLLASLQNFKKF